METFASLRERKVYGNWDVQKIRHYTTFKGLQGIVRNKKHNMEESFVTFHSLKVAKNSAKVDEKIVVESSKEFTQKLEENAQENAKIEEKTN